MQCIDDAVGSTEPNNTLEAHGFVPQWTRVVTVMGMIAPVMLSPGTGSLCRFPVLYRV